MRILFTAIALMIAAWACPAEYNSGMPADTTAVKPKKIMRANSNEAAIDTCSGKKVKDEGHPGKVQKKENGMKATFPGGDKAIREFIRRTQRYPEECDASRITGRVVVAVDIAPDGCVRNPRVTQSSGNRYMDAEALRVAGLMPAWTPAENKDAKEFTYKMTVSFRPKRK